MRGHAQEYSEAVKHLTPEFVRAFACAAGRCPDSCCRAGWQIVVDDETLEKYESLTGPDGDRVRNAVTSGQEPMLRQDENRVCDLLDPDGLCHAQKCFGHESLCRVCREYPRFHREFGSLTEHGLSLSCPTAFALAVSQKPAWAEWEDDAPIVPNDLDPERYLLLQEGRALALDLLNDESRPLWERLALVWELTERLQNGLDGQKRAGKLACARLRSPIGQKAALRRARPRFTPHPTPWEMLFGLNADSLASLAARFAGLEILSPAWKEGLEKLAQAVEVPGGAHCAPLQESLGHGGAHCAPLQEDSLRADAVYARYLWCSLFKYWLDAADDGRLLPRVRRSFAMTLLGRAMDQLVPGDRSWLQRISREIEHCEENLEALLDNIF